MLLQSESRVHRIFKRVTTDPWVHKVLWNSGYQVTPVIVSRRAQYCQPCNHIPLNLVFPQVSFQPLQIYPSRWHHHNPPNARHLPSSKLAIRKRPYTNGSSLFEKFPREVVSRSSHKNYFYVFHSPPGCWLPRITGGKEATLCLSLRNWMLSKLAMGQMIKVSRNPKAALRLKNTQLRTGIQCS